MLLALVTIFGFSVIAGGCGGGGGDSGSNPNYPVNPTPEPTPTPTPEPEPEPGDVDPYYEPFPLTQEDVDELYNAGYIEGTYEELMLPDGRSVKDVVDSMSQQEVNSSKSDANTITTRVARQPVTASEYIALMNKRAWDLAQDFPANDPKRIVRSHDIRSLDDGTVVWDDFGQSKYVYIFEYYGLMEDKDGNTNYKIAANYYGFGACDTLENGVGKQRERDELWNSCEDGMYGMDCVGFIMESTHAAGIPIQEVPLSASGEGLGNPAYWNKWLEGVSTTVSADRVSTDGDPLPGDILIFSSGNVRHVGLAATLGDETIVLHSTGKTIPPYTCADYKDVANGPIYNEETERWSKVSGPQWTLYSACIKSTWFGKETFRVRLVDMGTTPPPEDADVWDGTVDTSWYDNNRAASSYTIYKGSELAGLAKLVNDETQDFSGRTITLGGNIDLAGREWTPIGFPTYLDAAASFYSFRGTFDGGGHTISNLTIEMIETYPEGHFSYGLFGFNNSGTIKNINLIGVNIDVSSPYIALAGGIVGFNEDGTLTDCNVSGRVTASAPLSTHEDATLPPCMAGGIVGYTDGTLTNCDATGSVTVTSSSYSAAGGITGGSGWDSTLTDCDARSNVTAATTSSTSDASFAGGIAGFHEGTMANCDASGSVTATSSSYSAAGGIAGMLDWFDSTLTDCDASGKVTASAPDASSVYAGGVIGYLRYYDVITNNTFTASTGQAWGIGQDERKNPPGPSNTGCTLK
jgi:hypothetical protein